MQLLKISGIWLFLLALAMPPVAPGQERPREQEAPKQGEQKQEEEQAKPEEAKPQQPTPQDPRPDPAVPNVAAPVDPNTYLIGQQDVLFVRVWRENELTGNFVVRPDGMVSMPLAGDIRADGLTPIELKAKITEALRKVMTEPEVTVEVRQVNSKRFFISGEVARTGQFSLVTPTTVLEAISNAGGLRDFAKSKKIVIMRGSERLKFNYKDVIKGKKMEQNILLKPGDHIIVP